jgi:tetratricopeptide (TPR) repeat protein
MIHGPPGESRAAFLLLAMGRPLRAAAAAALVAAMAFSAGRLRAARDRPYDVDVVPPAAALRWLSLGHALLASHLYWLRAVQYIGEERAEVRGWDKLYPLVELVTDLDPGHGYAYQVGGVILASNGRLAESNALLEKGTRNVKDRYSLPYYRAFNAFYYEGDWTLAGRWAEIAARTPGAPAHIRQSVLAYYVKGDRVEAALDFLESAHREAQDDETRKALEEQIRQARLERLARRVDAAIARWRERHVVGPVVLESLIQEGDLDEIPPDPFGGELYPGADGKVRSTAHDFRYRSAASTLQSLGPGAARPGAPVGPPP